MLMRNMIASLVEMMMPRSRVGVSKKEGKLKKLEPTRIVTSPSYSVPSVMEDTKK